MTSSYESLPLILKVLIQLFFGYFVSFVYRIFRFLETRNVVTLLVGFLCIFGFGFIFWIIDLFTEITSNRITVCAN